jgi:hypothetical protein
LRHYSQMPDTWTPELQLRTRSGQCHLVLVGVTYGNGPTPLEASNDLLVRVLDLALGLRAGYRVGADLRVAEFLWEIGEMAVTGRGDIRQRVLGFLPDPVP